MNTPVKQEDINHAIWRACGAFRGVVDPSVYKDYVLTMLFVKYLSDVWDDHYETYKTQCGEHPELIDELMKNERFQLPEHARFPSLYARRHEPGNGERIDKALHAIEKANLDKLASVFQDISFNSSRLGEEKQKNEILRRLLEGFAKPEVDLRPSRIGNLDIIGNTYEFLIKNFAATSGRKAGEFYTPPEVSELMAELVAPQEGDEICDPTCGTGLLLLKCAAQIQRKYNGSKNYTLFGQEALRSTWALAKMNMFLHGQDNHQIAWGDSIRNPKLLDDTGKLRRFDVVVANPPFSLEDWGLEEASKDPFGRFQRGMPPKSRGDYAFILHMIETLKPDTGRMCVIMPHGVLFRGSSEGRIRKHLIKENLLDAVIGLPEKLFYGTSIPVAVLVFNKNKADDKVLFIDASREFEPGKNQNRLTQKSIDRIVTTYRSRQNVEKYAHLASLQEIRENDFNCNIPRYVDAFEEEEAVDIDALRRERVRLKAELAYLEKEIDSYLKELGYNQ